MIVLLVSLAEAERLLRGKPDLGLKEYIARQLPMEQLMPDENLPTRVLLEQIEGGERGYTVVIREFGTSEQADQAWAWTDGSAFTLSA